MNFQNRKGPHSSCAGYALVMVLFFASLSMLALGSALQWASSSAIQTERQNRYLTSVAAAEAATEKVLARVTADYKNGGESAVYSSLQTYRGLVPTAGTGARTSVSGAGFRTPAGSVRPPRHIPPRRPLPSGRPGPLHPPSQGSRQKL